MFWEIERHPQSSLYCAGDQRFIQYTELIDLSAEIEKVIHSDQKLLVALYCDNSLANIAAYLAVLRVGHAILLLNSATDSCLQEQILQRYHPEIIIIPGGNVDFPRGYVKGRCFSSLTVAFALFPSACLIHPETAVLLSTSGSTGNPKFVRLSYRNIQSNAQSIAEYLHITSDETAITSLPISYSYGLSLINSHFLNGANMVCTNTSVVNREFWEIFQKCKCTTYSGVPYSYLMLERLKFEQMQLPSLRTLTQAGGRLALDKIRYFSELARRKSYRFIVMYGQTEAAPRMSYVPFERLSEKIGSVGIAIPGGELRIAIDGCMISEPHREGEVVYMGPNVMLGYAETREDLIEGDVQGGVLYTGDVGYQDADGYLFITGRLNRFIKIFGLRFNLDDVERTLEKKFNLQLACVGRDDNLHILVESSCHNTLLEIKSFTSELYHIHHSAIKINLTNSIPVNSSGKKYYTMIEKELGLYEGT